MPESVEVYFMTQSLKEHVCGKILKSINVSSGRYLRKPETFSGYEEFVKCLPLKISDVKCKGKFIYIEFDSENNVSENKRWYLFNTLGMTGSWRIVEEIHSHVEFVFEDMINETDGMENKSIWFTDQQGYGTLKFVQGKKLLNKKLRSLGRDLLTDDITSDEFIKKYRTQDSKNICIVLLNQKIFSGVGNYIKSEALYRSKISPLHKIEDLSDSQLGNLLVAIKDVLHDSFENHGLTFRTYADVNGRIGKYKLQVYNNKTGKDAFGNKVVFIKASESPDGRGTYWSPTIQK